LGVFGWRGQRRVLLEGLLGVIVHEKGLNQEVLNGLQVGERVIGFRAQGTPTCEGLGGIWVVLLLREGALFVFSSTFFEEDLS
jgi:hypothetical protein